MDTPESFYTPRMFMSVKPSVESHGRAAASASSTAAGSHERKNRCHCHDQWRRREVSYSDQLEIMIVKGEMLPGEAKEASRKSIRWGNGTEIKYLSTKTKNWFPMESIRGGSGVTMKMLHKLNNKQIFFLFFKLNSTPERFNSTLAAEPSVD